MKYVLPFPFPLFGVTEDEFRDALLKCNSTHDTNLTITELQLLGHMRGDVPTDCFSTQTTFAIENLYWKTFDGCFGELDKEMELAIRCGAVGAALHVYAAIIGSHLIYYPDLFRPTLMILATLQVCSPKYANFDTIATVLALFGSLTSHPLIQPSDAEVMCLVATRLICVQEIKRRRSSRIRQARLSDICLRSEPDDWIDDHSILGWTWRGFLVHFGFIGQRGDSKHT